MQGNERVIVALDTPDMRQVKRILAQLRGLIRFYKIGFELFSAHGWKAVEYVKRGGNRVFLDLKLHDIPTTVSRTASVLCEHDIDMFNLHALGGLEMMKSAVKAVKNKFRKAKARPAILGVTILTSHTEMELKKELGLARNLNQEIICLAGLAKRAALDGVVCSPLEIQMIRKRFGRNFLIVTPGVRPREEAIEGKAKRPHQGVLSHPDDQKRVLSPREAVDQGADYLVIGRPITAAPDCARAARIIIGSLPP